MTISLPAAPEFGTPVEQKPRPELLEFLAARRSSSAVTLSEPAPSAGEIEALISLAARVPDHGKLAPWRFIVLEGGNKAAFAARLQELAASRNDVKAVAKLAKLKVPPACIAVISRTKTSDIHEWEQILSAGAVCTTLLYAAQALGYGANWITDWYAYDAQAKTILGLEAQEQVAGFILLGSIKEPPLERERPDAKALTSTWRP